MPNENTKAEAGVECQPGLTDSKGLLKTIFPNEKIRPTVRWLEMQRKARRIPFVKIGRLVFFDPENVRAALNAQRSAQYGVKPC